MTRLKMEDIIRKSAQEPSFEMPEEHLAQAMSMIRSRRSNRKLFVWFGAGLVVLVIFGVGIFSSMDFESISIQDRKIATTPLQKNDIDGVKDYTLDNETKLADLKASDGELNQKSSPKHTTTAKTSESPIVENSTTLVSAEQPGTLKIDQRIAHNSPRTENVLKSPTGFDLLEEGIDNPDRVVYTTPSTLDQGATASLLLDDTPVLIGDLPSFKERNLWKWGLKLGGGILDKNIQSYTLGLFLKRKIGKTVFISIEPGIQWTQGYDELHLIQRVDHYGLEVMSEYYALQPDFVINGVLSANIGWEKNRWMIQAGPKLAFLQQGYGSLSSLKADVNQYTVEEEVSHGWMTEDNTQDLNLGLNMEVSYRISPNTLLGLFAGWQQNMYFKKNDIREKRNQNVVEFGLQYRYEF